MRTRAAVLGIILLGLEAAAFSPGGASLSNSLLYHRTAASGSHAILTTQQRGLAVADAPRLRSTRGPQRSIHMTTSPEDSSNDWSFMMAPVPGDELVGMVSDNGECTIRAVVATGLVKGAAKMQKTSPVCSAALGRTLICALMMAQGKKDGSMYGETERESLQIDVRADGPIKQVFALADGVGEVRGYTANPFVEIPLNDMGKLDVAGAVGQGFITVVRNNPYWKQPYTGITQIVSGEIAEDMAHYLTESEQTPSALGCGVLVRPEDDEVIAAGGWLVQMLPGATEETISQIEKNIMNLAKSPTTLIREGKSAMDICTALSEGLRPNKVVPEYVMKPRFTCKCSIDKVYRTVALVPRKEMDEILAEKGKIEVKCEFCKRDYVLSGEELEEVYATATSKDEDSKKDESE
jgi:molecular chaperone Hsp33